jgi:hypothetical protein
MHYRPLIIAWIFYCLTFSSCKEKDPNEFVISNQIDTIGLNYNNLFATSDKYTDSISNKINPANDLVGKKEVEIDREFRKNNIALVYIFDIADSMANHLGAMPTILQFKKENDAVHLIAAVGFFGGYVVDLKIKDNKYSGTFIESEQDSMFKHQVSDTKFTKEITVDAERQKLYLSKTPTFNVKEQFFGQYEATFEPYYENNMGITMKKMKVKVVFKSNI